MFRGKDVKVKEASGLCTMTKNGSQLTIYLSFFFFFYLKLSSVFQEIYLILAQKRWKLRKYEEKKSLLKYDQRLFEANIDDAVNMSNSQEL